MSAAPSSTPASHAMTLRDGSVVGGARGQLPAPAADAFVAAVRAVFTRWTALRLAVEGCWGGPDSDAKAGQMAGDVVAWFKGGQEHYADELEDELAEAMLSDFGTQLEDDSPREVARTLVQIYHELGTAGASQTLDRLLATPAPPLGQSLREAVDRDGTVVGTAAGGGRGGGGGDDDSSSDDGGEDGAPTPAPSRPPRPEPVVDEDGFTTVVRRRR